MNAGEVAYRVFERFRNYYEKAIGFSFHFDTRVMPGEFRLFKEMPGEWFDDVGEWFNDVGEWFNDVDELLLKADRLCENKLDLFALRGFYFGEEINYHMDYKSRRCAPSTVFGKSINYRDCGRIGDIKYIWEVNRHLYLVTLGIAFSLTHETKYLDKFKYFLNSWFDQNPFMLGVNWLSPLELGIRLITWTICWHLLESSLEQEFQVKWLESIYRHCWFIYNNFSRYSSANNHLIGEASGLFTACTALPKFEASDKWRAKAFRILTEEALKQNCIDGVNKEQAIAYQQFVLDFLVIAGLTGKAGSIDFPESYWLQIEKMLEFLAALEDKGCNFPHYGDDDDGFVLDTFQGKKAGYRSPLNAGAYIFNRKDFLLENTKIDNKAKLLLSIGGYCTHTPPVREGTVPVRFDAGGYYLLGTDFHGEKEQKLLFDAAPIGYLSLAAHGHSDALSFHLSCGGCPLMVDPGTYAYHNDKVWRNYFRSTFAHNTVCVDGTNQSKAAGNFMWSRKANANLLYYNDYTGVKASHDGYWALKDKVTHTREIVYNQDINYWHIIDGFLCRGRHKVELCFHLHPDCRVKSSDSVVHILFEKGICSLCFDSGVNVRMLKGEVNPPAGWYSDSFDVKIPSITIVASKEISGQDNIKTGIQVTFN